MYMFSIRYMQMRALLVILEKPSYLTWKQFNKNKPSWGFFCDWHHYQHVQNASATTKSVLANGSSSQDVDRTFDQVKSQHSLVVHWHRSITATVQAPLRSNEDGCVASQWSVEQYSVCILRAYRTGTNQLLSGWRLERHVYLHFLPQVLCCYFLALSWQEAMSRG